MLPVSGATIERQAVRIAGALAELGQQTLTLTTEQGARELLVRETNLPALIVDAAKTGNGVLRAPAIGTEFRLTGTGVFWE